MSLVSCAQINNSNTINNEAPSVAEPKAVEEEKEEIQEVTIESQKKSFFTGKHESILL